MAQGEPRTGLRGGRTRAQLVAETLQVADALRSRFLTVTELAATTSIHPRTIYRILHALEEAGFPLTVHEEARASGPGRRQRRYHLERARRGRA